MHQPYRAELVPGLDEALRLRAPGLLGCALSGAGPRSSCFMNVDTKRFAISCARSSPFMDARPEVISGRIARDGYTVEVPN